MHRRFTRIPNGGIDRTAAAHVTSPDSFYDLLNLRPEIGRLSQTAPIVTKQAMTQLASETDSPVRFIDLVRTAAAALRYLVINEQTARYVTPTSLSTQTLIPAITQSKIANNTTNFGQVLLYGYNSTDFSTSGDYIEITIASATTFNWTRNGSGGASGVTVGRNLSLGANGLIVDFLETTGYTVGNVWRWTRTETVPYSSSVASTKNFSYSSAPYNTDVYLGGIGRNVMRVRDGFITSVGYKRVFGKHVAVFQNHLVVSHFAEGVYSAVSGYSDPYAATTTPFKIGWSDLNNPDYFYATDVNEADTYDMPYNNASEAVNYGVTGLGKLGQALWIYTADGMSDMQYLGLPNVMQILPRHNVGSVYHNGLVITPFGHYFIGRNNIYFFDGVQPRPIGNGVFEQFYSDVIQLDPTSDNSESVIGYYNAFRQEVSWIYWTPSGQCKQIVYSEKFGRWHFRNMPYETANAPRAIGRVYNSPTRLVYGGTAKINYDYDSTESTSDIVLDDKASAGYTNPYADTVDLLYQNIFGVKEPKGIQFDAGWDSGVTGLRLAHSIRKFVSSAVSFTTVSGDDWTPTSQEPFVGKFNANGRVFRFRFTFVGSKPVGCVLNGWGDIAAGVEAFVVK